MAAYYNENDPFAADWLRLLIENDLIASGDVDERDIEDVTPDDLRHYSQHHFFAGIGGWSLALRLAGWPDDEPVWTGSCPCQPFSAAGTRKGTDDPRHLWPHWRWLVDQCRPPVVFGEQVASKVGRSWLSGVRIDLEALGYGVGSADLCAAGIGAPHIRQRLFWVADSSRDGRRQEHSIDARRAERSGPEGWAAGLGLCGADSRMAEPSSGGCTPGALFEQERGVKTGSGDAVTDRGRLGNADSYGPQAGRQTAEADDTRSQGRRILSERADELSPWEASLGNWVYCTDGKARRIEPGLEPLAHGVPNRVGRLRGYGNAIVPQLAAAFIEAFNEVGVVIGG